MRARTGFHGLSALLASAAWVLLAGAAHATPVIVEAGWQLTRTVDFSDPNAAHYNSVDGKLYVNKVVNEVDGGGVYRIEDDGSSTLVVSETRPRGLTVDQVTGDVYFSTGGNEAIYRIPYGTTTQETWVTGFGPGDDDPIGLSIVPTGWMGNIQVPDGMGGTVPLAPGMGLVVDEGFNNPDRVWAWDTAGPEGEQIVHDDDGTLQVGVDVAFTEFDAWVADTAGFVYKINPDGTLSVLLTSSPLSMPTAVAGDPITRQLYVLDGGLDQLLRIDTATGQVAVVVSGLTVADFITDTAGLDVSPDGKTLFVTDRGADKIYVFSMVPEPMVSALLALGLGGLAWFGRTRSARIV